jgi:hypothetical protein
MMKVRDPMNTVPMGVSQRKNKITDWELVFIHVYICNRDWVEINIYIYKGKK